MPAPNLGLVGARGVEAMQKDIQRIEAERVAMRLLEEKRAADQIQQQINLRKIAMEEGEATTRGEIGRANVKVAERGATTAEGRLGFDTTKWETEWPTELSLKQAQTRGADASTAYTGALAADVARKPEAERVAREHALNLEAVRAGYDSAADARRHGYRLSEDRAKGLFDRETDVLKAQPGLVAAAQKAHDETYGLDPIVETMMNTIHQIETLPGKSGAVGYKNWASGFGIPAVLGLGDKPIAGSPERTFRDYVESLKAQLTLDNLPKLKGYGQMSNADREMLLAAGTALSADMTPEAFDAEIQRIKRVVTPDAHNRGYYWPGEKAPEPRGSGVEESKGSITRRPGVGEQLPPPPRPGTLPVQTRPGATPPTQPNRPKPNLDMGTLPYTGAVKRDPKTGALTGFFAGEVVELTPDGRFMIIGKD